MYETPECRKNTLSNILHAVLLGIATTSTLIAFSFSDAKQKRVVKVDSQIFKRKKTKAHSKHPLFHRHNILSFKR